MREEASTKKQKRKRSGWILVSLVSKVLNDDVKIVAQIKGHHTDSEREKKNKTSNKIQVVDDGWMNG